MAHTCKQHRNQMLQHLSGEAGEPNSTKPKQQPVTLDNIVTLNGDCRSSLLLGVLPGSLLALHRQPSFLPFPSSRPPSSLGGQFLLKRHSCLDHSRLSAPSMHTWNNIKSPLHKKSVWVLWSHAQK